MAAGASEWTTEQPTELGFYWATNGSPVLYLWIIDRNGELIEYGTWQTAWAGRPDIPEDSMSDEAVILPVTERDAPKYWCKIPIPDRPKGNP